jgi:hypothetical protein
MRQKRGGDFTVFIFRPLGDLQEVHDAGAPLPPFKREISL